MANEFFTIVCPTIGVIICIFMFGSPMKEILNARSSKDLGTLNPVPFAVIIFNCIGWMTYGIMIRDYFVFWSNLPGLCFGTFFSLSSLQLLARRDTPKDQQNIFIIEILIVSSIFFWSFMAMITCIGMDNITNGAAVIGSLACIASILYYSAPLSTAVTVIRTRDASSLFAPMISINLANALLWVFYGAIGVNNPLIWVPNIIGVILATFQLSLVFVFKKKPKSTTAVADKKVYDNADIHTTADNPLHQDAHDSSSTGRLSICSTEDDIDIIV
jgi:solute carrier family 50 protein (sugar transporter)